MTLATSPAGLRSFAGPNGPSLTDDEVRQHPLHPGDLRPLVDLYVRCEPEHRLVLARTLGAEQGVDHADGAAMMLDHEGQEEPVELRTPRRVELHHLLVR